jgi:hypothetical protein
MNDSVILAIGAIVTAVASAVKQFYDNKELKRWVCSRDPCDQRIKPT